VSPHDSLQSIVLPSVSVLRGLTFIREMKVLLVNVGLRNKITLSTDLTLLPTAG